MIVLGIRQHVLSRIPIQTRVADASLLGVATTFIGATACGRTIQGPCRLTPQQTEGPFYPIDTQLDEDSDLTQVSGKQELAEGRIIYVSGQVRDLQCRPLEGVRVKIWQASARGRYNHPRDQGNLVPMDSNFQGWGKAITDQHGRYLFKTIHPGQYPAGPGWIRPSHIHFKLTRPGLDDLTTQMYFAGDPHLDFDRIFLDVPSDERAQVVIDREAPGPEFEPDASLYRFDLAMGYTT